MAKNKNRQPARESRTAEEQQRERERAKSAAAERTPPTGAARKGHERRFGHN